jgi:hypothetical protein
MVLRVGVKVREERAEEAQDEGDQRQREQRVEVGPIQVEFREQPPRGRT